MNTSPPVKRRAFSCLLVGPSFKGMGGGRVVIHSKELVEWGDHPSGSKTLFKRILRRFPGA